MTFVNFCECVSSAFFFGGGGESLGYMQQKLSLMMIHAVYLEAFPKKTRFFPQ